MLYYSSMDCFYSPPYSPISTNDNVHDNVFITSCYFRPVRNTVAVVERTQLRMRVLGALVVLFCTPHIAVLSFVGNQLRNAPSRLRLRYFDVRVCNRGRRTNRGKLVLGDMLGQNIQIATKL